MAGEGWGQIGYSAGSAGNVDPMIESAQKQIQYQQDSRNQDAQIKKQQMLSHKFLTEMGIAKDEVTPPSSADLESTLKQFSQQHGANINFNMAKDASEEDKVKFLSGIMQAYKVPPPKPKINTTYNMEAARNLGAKMSSDGTASVSPTANQSEWKPRTQEEAIAFEKSKAEAKDIKDKVPASIKRQKNLDTTSLIQNTKRYENTNKRITETLKSLDEIPQGAVGNWDIKLKTLTGSKDPVLAKWQDLKSLLSKIQLGQLQFTKGAISDREMEFFKTAVANDDIASYPRIKAVLERALEDNNTEIESAKASYEKNYGEDPDEILGKSVTDVAGITKGHGKSVDYKSKYGLQ